MSNQINDGGPAFPTNATATTHGFYQDGQPCATHYGTTPGMTLRDYFAAAALQGSIANPNSNGNWEDFALDAYRYADAMLERRKR